MQYLRWLTISFMLSVLAGPAVAQQLGPFSKGIGYPSVAAALADLKSRSDVDISTKGGWTIVTDREAGAQILWSFTPQSHPAHPAAVKRSLVEQDGEWVIYMGVLCQAEKAACDKLVAEFEALNNKIREAVEKKAEARPKH